MSEVSQFCPNCGTAMPAELKFCTGCGTPRAGEAAAVDETFQGPSGNSGGKNLLFIGGGVLAVALLGAGAYFAFSGSLGFGGSGGADKNGDGTITAEEFRVEMLELKRLQPGNWTFSLSGGSPEAGSENASMDFDATLRCSRRAWRDINEFYDELQNPRNFQRLEEELSRAQTQQNLRYSIDRFSIDGDNVSLTLSSSGTFADRNANVTWEGSFSLEGTVSETSVNLSGPTNMKFEVSGSQGSSQLSFKTVFEGEYAIEMERTGDCAAEPDFEPAFVPEPDYGFYEEAPAMEAAPAEESVF